MSLLVHCPQTGFTPIQTDHDVTQVSSWRFSEERRISRYLPSQRRKETGEVSVTPEVLSDQEMVIQETKTECCCCWHHDAITTEAHGPFFSVFIVGTTLDPQDETESVILELDLLENLSHMGSTHTWFQCFFLKC